MVKKKLEHVDVQLLLWRRRIGFYMDKELTKGKWRLIGWKPEIGRYGIGLGPSVFLATKRWRVRVGLYLHEG